MRVVLRERYGRGRLLALMAGWGSEICGLGRDGLGVLVGEWWVGRKGEKGIGRDRGVPVVGLGELGHGLMKR